MGWLQEPGRLLKETVVAWLEDDIPSRGAALSYYVLLSLGPLLVLVVAALEFFVSEDNVRSVVISSVRDQIGARAANTAATVLQRVEVPNAFAAESILTLGLLLFGATAVFANIRGSLDKIWGVAPDNQSKREILLGFLYTRLRGFVMIAVTGVVLAVSFAVTSGVGFLASAFEESRAHGWLLIRGLDTTVSVLLTGLLFGAIYRTLPSVRIRWSTVWVGAFATALLFVIGKSLVAWLIASASWTSYYGPGASVVAFLAWIYFSAQIFFLGAEFTQVWSRRSGGVMSEAG